MKKFLSIILALFVLLSTSNISLALSYGEEWEGYVETTPTVFSDVPEWHWAYKSIMEVYEKNWFNGYVDGTFRPDKSITRAEALKVFVVFLGLDYKSVDLSNLTYYDVGENDWYAPYIEAGKDLFPEHTTIQGKRPFNPDMPVTREDTIYALVKALNCDGAEIYPDQSVLDMFTDKHSISESIRSVFAVALMPEHQLVSGFPDSTIRAQAALTRAEFASLLRRGSEHGKHRIDTKISKINITPSSNAILEVGDSITLTANAEYTDGSQMIYYNLSPQIKSGNGVIELDERTITALKAGTAIINYDNDLLKNEELIITVKDPTVSRINLTPSSSESIEIGDEFIISATANYSDGSQKKYTELSPYIASGHGVISLNGTMVTGVKAGTAVIKYNNEPLMGDSLTVTVTIPNDKPKIKITGYEEVTEEEVMIITGTVSDKTDSVDLTCNGRDIDIRGNSFEYKANLDIGDNTFKFLAVNEYGNRDEKTIEITRNEPEPTTVEMINVVGKNDMDAEKMLNEIGLNVEFETVWDDNAPPKTVLKQDISEGKEVELGTTVKLIISGGKNDWMGWVDDLPSYVNEKDYVVEQKTQYRCKKLEETTGNSPNMSGWTQSGKNETWGDWSGWSKNSVSSSSTREVNTRERENPREYKTQWNYSRYYGWSSAKNCYLSWPIKGNNTKNYEERGWSDSPLENRGKGDGTNTTVYRDTGDSKSVWWWNETTRSVELPVTYYTEYRYRDKIITYQFTRWTGWSEWTDNKILENNKTEVETRTVYRYKFR